MTEWKTIKVEVQNKSILRIIDLDFVEKIVEKSLQKLALTYIIIHCMN